VSKFELSETQFERTYRNKIACISYTCSEKMTVLSTFLECSLNFLSNNVKKHYKSWYGYEGKWYQSLNCQKHSMKGQLGTKSPVTSSWSEKIAILSTFLESLLNFLSNDIKNTRKLSTVREKNSVKL